MEFNSLEDIPFIEKSAEERAVIENICKTCEEFQLGENPKCNVSNNTLVFSQLKKFHKCPISKW